jgi:NADH-quinone oxidoreductase subunit N
MVWLAIVAIFFSVIGAFYYIRIVKLMYFDDPQDTSPIEADRSMRFMLSLNGIAVLVLGVVPGWLLGLVTQSCCSANLVAHLLK